MSVNRLQQGVRIHSAEVPIAAPGRSADLLSQSPERFFLAVLPAPSAALYALAFLRGKIAYSFEWRFLMKKFLARISVLSLLAIAACLCLAQNGPAKKSYTFHGKVVSVNRNAKMLTVDGEKVEGWMSAMTMNYKVDDPSVVDKLKPGDQITATVYDGDYVLHDVKAGPSKDARSKP